MWYVSTPIACEIATKSRIVNLKKYRVALCRAHRNGLYLIKDDLLGDSSIDIDLGGHNFDDTIVELRSWQIWVDINRDISVWVDIVIHVLMVQYGWLIIQFKTPVAQGWLLLR